MKDEINERRTPVWIALPEVFTASVTALRRNKTRSMLTALGIIIGVAAVIAAFAVGAGANKSIDEQISSFGSNFIMVFPDRSSRSTMGSRSYLTDEDAEAIAREVSGIDAVAPMNKPSVPRWSTKTPTGTPASSAARRITPMCRTGA